MTIVSPSLRIGDALTLARSLGTGTGTGIAVDNIEEAAIELNKRWTEPHRAYHGISHLIELLDRMPKADNDRQQAQLILAILFHDAVYEPHRNDNEEESVKLLAKMDLARGEDFNEIKRAILSTKTGTHETQLAVYLNLIDRSILATDDMGKAMEYERGIRREYQFASWETYREERVKFLRAQGGEMMKRLADYVETFRPTIGVYAGSFDPFHVGHQNILDKSRALFDKTIVAVGVNKLKSQIDPMVRANSVRFSCPYFEVVPFEGLLTDYLAEVRTYAEPVLIRGLRDGFDLQYELNQARFMEDLDPTIQIAYLATDRKYQHVSSTNLRALERIAPGRSMPYLP